MALVDQGSLCFPHAWVGSCPKCKDEATQAIVAEKQRWLLLSWEEKLEELHQLVMKDKGLIK
jgi:hypothetical protein